MVPDKAAEPADDVAAAADELYGLPREEFVAARNERARQARGQGARDAAAAIGQLAKPSMVAWLANQLVRQHRDLIGPLLELGESMREATAQLDTARLRQLSSQQRHAIRVLVQQAGELAAAAGHAFADSTARGLAETLHAALADAAAARQLSAGQLTSGLAQSGFPAVSASQPAADAWQSPAPAARSLPGAPSTTSAATDHEQAERARDDEADARRAAEAAGQARQQAHSALAQAERSLRQAQDDADRLRAALDAVIKAHANADSALHQARQDADEADETARQAEQRLRDATARRRDLEL